MIILYILNFLFNKYLDIKYYVNKIFFSPNKETKIEKIYFINSDNQIILSKNLCLKSINSKLNYCSQINLMDLINNHHQNHILQIEYLYKQKHYIFNIDCQRILKEIIYFPHYSEKELKTKNMNKIVYCNLGNNYVNVLNKYSGPLNDFYLSKGLGIPLNKMYSNQTFIFKNQKEIIFEDIFLNTYKIDDVNKVLEIKSTLSNNKINKKSLDIFKNIFDKKKIF